MIIKDKLIEPYQIHHSNGCYDLVELTDKKNKNGEDVFKTIGHYSNINSAISKIIKLQLEGENDVYTLKEYRSGLKYLYERISHLI